MPVKENNPTSENADLSAETERKKQQLQEENFKKSEKLLPFLNAKAENHISRITKLDNKISALQHKISVQHNDIDFLTARADKLEDTNKMLKMAVDKLPMLKGMIENNEKKIKKIREVKIPAKQEKIKVHTNKINQLSGKRKLIQHKLDRVISLNGIIKSFGISNNKARHEAFSASLENFRTSTSDCMTDKYNAMKLQRENLIERYTQPETSYSEQFRLQQRINDLGQKMDTLSKKIEKLDSPDEPKVKIEKSVFAAADVIAVASEKEKVSMPALSADVIEAAMKGETVLENQISQMKQERNKIQDTIDEEVKMLKNPYVTLEGVKEDIKKDLPKLQKKLNEIDTQISAMSAKKPELQPEIPVVPENPLKSVEEQLESNANSIDGILNNGADMGLFSIEQNGEQRFYKSEIVTANELLQVAANSETPYADMMKMGQQISEPEFAEIQQSDKFKFSVEVNFDEQNVHLYAVNNGKGGIAEPDRNKENTIIQTMPISQFIKKHEHENTEKQPLKANPEYYQSLPEEERSVHYEPKNIAEQIMQKLDEMKIPFSAVECRNESIAITVSKNDDWAFCSVEKQFKTEHSRRLINPEFFKSLPRDERRTRRMPESEAVDMMKELEQKGIPHTAILDGEKSNVTVQKKDAKVAFFSRNQMKREVKRQQDTPPEPSKQKTQKRNQGIE